MSGIGVSANFEPIYAALFQLLSNSATVMFSGTAAGAVVTGISDTSMLFPGIAVQGVDVAGLSIKTVDGPSQVTLNQAVSDGPVSLQAGFQTTDRLLKHWADVDAGMQPALYLTQTDETATKRTGQPTNWVLDCMIWVYTMSPSESQSAQPGLNVLLANIRNALGCDASGPGRAQNRQTLGGTCFDCFISGKIITDDGLLGQQAVARIPIRIQQNGPN